MRIILGVVLIAVGATCVALSFYAFCWLWEHYSVGFSDWWIPWLAPAIGLVGIGLIAGGVYTLRPNVFRDAR